MPSDCILLVYELDPGKCEEEGSLYIGNVEARLFCQ